MTGNTSQNNALEGRDAKTGRFITGNNGGGRKLGSRNKLTTEFLDDLYAKWQKHGPDVLERVIRDDPAAFLRTVAQILPKEIDVNAGSDFDGMENVSDILQKVAEEAGPEAALVLAKAFGLEYPSEITDAPRSVVSTIVSTAPKLGYYQSQPPINRPKR
jgi:hypothetical protein